MKKREKKLRDLWYTNKYINICITGVPKRKEREKLCKEIMAEKFPDVRKYMDIPIKKKFK